MTTHSRWRIVLLLLLSTILVIGCGGRGFLAPVGNDPRVSDIAEPKPEVVRQHVVTRGETMYAIAFRYGLDYRQVANANQIAAPFLIYPGQKLRIDPQADMTLPTAQKMATASQITTKQDTSASLPSDNEQPATSVEQNTTPNVTTTKQSGDLGWVWPADGKVLVSFKNSGNKGIDIAGKLGHPVRAAADGKVVYSGGGLIGYGELIIIKHNKHYLSAYGHNNNLIVKQGDIVVSGQHIADMGRSGTDIIKLHFEIRRDGKPVDPIRYLPK
tara:strand:+ start:140 stop:952 length:813 start_codon:yes stop_codon:yes gene_type:complete